MTKTIASPWISGYVNAVLRKAAKGYHQVPFPDKKDPVSHLSVFESFPAWLVSRWIKRIGFDATERLCKSINQIPSIVVRANTLKTTVQHLLSALVPLAENVHICDFSPVGIFFSNPRIPVGRMKPFLDGWFQVQDEAAQLVTGLLNPQPGERIMDACSGQGGKTGHIAQTMENRGRIVAVDWNEDKLSKLNKEMDRLGVSNVTGMKCDLSRPLENEFADAFHRILLDAPCSGLGVLRRNPEAKWRVLETDLKRYRNTQLQMLHHLCRCVRPSGVLVYAVCSMEPEENEDVIDRFLKEHSNFALRQIHPEISEQGNSLLDKRGYLKTSPGMHPMDGFFGACLQRLT
jgi:16S rRNA (cytosine967-C5)-methyltransferase